MHKKAGSGDWECVVTQASPIIASTSSSTANKASSDATDDSSLAETRKLLQERLRFANSLVSIAMLHLYCLK